LDLNLSFKLPKGSPEWSAADRRCLVKAGLAGGYSCLFLLGFDHHALEILKAPSSVREKSSAQLSVGIVHIHVLLRKLRPAVDIHERGQQLGKMGLNVRILVLPRQQLLHDRQVFGFL
jgi:hypothetical protein